MREDVERIIQKIRPSLQMDGGDIELVSVVDGVVNVRLKGACHGCPMSQRTLSQGVEKAIKAEIPDIKSVVAV